MQHGKVIFDAVQKAHDFRQFFKRENLRAFDESGFFRVVFRHDKPCVALLYGGYEKRHHAAYSAKFPVQRKFAQKNEFLVLFRHDLLGRGKDSDGKSKVKSRPVFFRVGGRKVDGYPFCRINHTAVFDCGTNALLGLFHGGSRKPHDFHTRKTCRDICFDVDGVSFDTRQGVTHNF